MAPKGFQVVTLKIGWKVAFNDWEILSLMHHSASPLPSRCIAGLHMAALRRVSECFRDYVTETFSEGFQQRFTEAFRNRGTPPASRLLRHGFVKTG